MALRSRRARRAKAAGKCQSTWGFFDCDVESAGTRVEAQWRWPFREFVRSSQHSPQLAPHMLSASAPLSASIKVDSRVHSRTRAGVGAPIGQGLRTPMLWAVVIVCSFVEASW